MNILVLNCGSSSVKFAIIDSRGGKNLARGVIDKLGSEGANLKIKTEDQEVKKELGPMDQRGGLESLMEEIQTGALQEVQIDAVGHRVVHGGEDFSGSILINDAVVATIESCCKLAPLHNPANLMGIQLIAEKRPDLQQVAVFDTAFHQTLPPHAYRYAVPDAWYREDGIRRYGFHGTSHRFVSAKAAEMLGRPLEELNLITMHLGNGSSGTAILQGKSVDTTMGLTPLEGLVMGTRSGDIDPGIFAHLQETRGWDLSTIHKALNKESGLMGLSGLSSDLRTLEENRDQPDVALALDVMAYRIARQTLALCAALDHLDALVFTGGIGENSAPVRERTLSHLKILGLELDPELNAVNGSNSEGRVSTSTSTTVLVVPTDEELMIAQDTATVIQEG